MILVHRLGGDPLYLNADLIETAEATPDTVIGLVDGQRLLVRESPDEVVDLVRRFRASLLVAADEIRDGTGRGGLTVVPSEDGRVDVLFLGGLLLALAGIVLAMVIDGNALGPLLAPSSFLLVLTATIGAGIMSFRPAELRAMPASALRAFTGTAPDVGEVITELARVSETARRHGMLALDDRLEEIDDRFLATGVQMLVDGADEDVVRDGLQIEIAATDERHRTAISFFRTLGAYAPTFGMVGTLIGLVNMLGNLSDPEQLGSGLALALLTTFYGVLLANLVCNPIASRLERLNETELSALDVALDGLLAVRGGAGPRQVIERLEAYLPPSQRAGVGDRLGRGRDEEQLAEPGQAA